MEGSNMEASMETRMESSNIESNFVEGVLEESSPQNQLFGYQGKHQQAADHWLQLITQITLDYKRPIATELHVESEEKERVLMLAGEKV